MSSLVGSALLARRAQTITVFALTVVAALGGSAAPWFLHWAHAAVAASDIAAAPVTQRLVNISGVADYEVGAPSPLAAVRDQVGRAVPIPGQQVSIDARLMENVGAISVPSHPIVGLSVAARDGVCVHLIVEGACPDAADTVMIGRATAAALTVHVGDPVAVGTALQTTPAFLRISGIYDPRDALSPYWAGSDLLGGAVGLSGDESEPAAFVSEATLLKMASDRRMSVEAHVVLPASAFHDSGEKLTRQMNTARAALREQGLGLVTDANVLINQIQVDQGLVRDAVVVATVEMVLLSWFGLFLAVRQASVVRRFDIGLLKLRGAPRWQIGWLTGQQSAIPMLAGLIVGGFGGYLAAALLAGDALPAASSTVESSVVVAVLVGGGALLASVFAEWSVLRSSVVVLLRRVPTRRSGWRASVVDMAVVVLALAGVYQGYADIRANGEPSILSLLAPGLVGLAVALLLARAMPWLAVRAGASALAAGYAGGALGALHVARRPGTERIFAVIAVAVSVLGTSFFGAANAQGAWRGRAELELGAARVLQVRALNSTALLHAVRNADPDGRSAMAVARSDASRILAADMTRLAAVALVPAGYGLPAATDLARLLRPAPPVDVTVRDGPLYADLDGPDASGVNVFDSGGRPLPVVLSIVYADPAGVWHTTNVGPVTSGEHRYEAMISGCTDGCRLVSFETVTHRSRATVGVRRLSQSDVVVDSVALSDIRRWRSRIGPDVMGPRIATHDGVLDVGVSEGPAPTGLHLDNRVFYSGTPVPVPIALAGPTPDEVRAGDPRITVLGTEHVPYHAIALGRVLPGLEKAGALMDLEYAQASLGSADEAASLEVWLSSHASSSIVDSLRSQGIQVLSDLTLDSVTGRWAAQGPGLALRFQLFAAIVVLLLAGGTVVITSAVQQRERARELAALRRQGMPDRSMRFACRIATLVVVAAAIWAGVVAALIGQSVVAASLPIFTDRWSVLPHRIGVSPVPGALAIGVALLVLVPAGWFGVAGLVRRVRRATGVGR